MTTMRAALLEEAGRPLTVVSDLQIAPPQADQVRVRVTHCGVCRSDLSIADGTFPAPVPIVLGHEAAGIVDAVGSDVHGLAPGDPVVLTPVPPCGRCHWCVRGEPGVCVNAASIMTSTHPDGTTGLMRAGETVYRGVGLGAFGEYVVVPSTGAVKVPAAVPPEIACVIGCAVQTGVGAVFNTARVAPGATVLVLGAGGIGLSVVQGARIAGSARILVSDPIAGRREMAGRLGATDVIDPDAEDVLARVRAVTGVGVDYAFDAVGRAALIQLGVAATRNGGMTVCVGAAPVDEAVTITPAALFTVTEKKVVGCTLGSCNSLREIPRLVALWQAGRLDLETLVTDQRPLAEVNAALDDMRAGRGIRTVLAH